MVANRKARWSDPHTSELAVRAITADMTIYEKILRAAHRSAADGRAGFTDDYLARETGVARNIVARVRLECERDLWLERGATVRRPDGVEVMTFRLIPGRELVLSMVEHIEWDEGAT